MSPLTPEQQLSHEWRDELPGVTLHQDRDERTFEVRLRAEAHISSQTHHLTEEALIRSNGEAGRVAVEQIGAEMRDKALYAFGLHVAIQRMRHEERTKFEAVAAQLDVLREAAAVEVTEAREAGDRTGEYLAMGRANSFRAAAAMIRAVQ